MSKRLPGSAAFHRSLRIETWIRGRPSYDSIAVIRGHLWRFHPKHGHGIVRTRTGYITCRWYDNKIPPNARLGERIVVIGELLTSALGEIFYLSKCVVLKPGASYATMKREILDVMDKYILPVNTYVEEPEPEHDSPPRLLLSDLPDRTRGLHDEMP